MGWIEKALRPGASTAAAEVSKAVEEADVNFDWQEDSKRPIQIIRIDGTSSKATEKTEEEKWEEIWNSYQGWEEDRENAAKIREEAIANGTWKKAGSTETIEATQATESSVPIQPDMPVTHLTSMLACSIGSFILGIIVMYLFSKLHIKKIKSKHEDQLKKIKEECDIKVAEARAALDRMLIIASQK